MPAFRTHTDEQITKAVRESVSIREVLGRLGLAQAGGNYKEFRKHADRLGLDLSHFRGKGHGKAPHVGRPLSEILVEHSSYTNNNALRLRLLRAGMIDAVCAECGLRDWRGRPITLHLDHINGVNTDHRIQNLRLLCPNCHSQTETYCGRNKREEKRTPRRPE